MIQSFDRQTDFMVLICAIDKSQFSDWSVWICDIVLERLKKIYGWNICFEYDYLQSHIVVIVHFQTEALFTASLTYKRWKVKKNYGRTLCTSDINTVVSTESFRCCLLSNGGSIFTAITYMYFDFTSKKQVSKGLLTGDQKRTFLLSKRELCLHELKHLSLTQCTEQ